MKVMNEMYPDSVEYLHPNSLPPRGNPVEVNCFVFIDRSGDNVTRRLQTGILLYFNSAPIIWYSNCQNTVEISNFGSEFFALRLSSKQIISLR